MGDIRHFVTSSLSRHKYMDELSKQHTEEGSLLVEDVVKKARGVFLWVKLVVKSLLRGLCDFNRISDLRKRVEYLPEDLEALYSHMLQNTEPFYHEQASYLFQIFRTAQSQTPERVRLLDLSWAEDDDHALTEQAPIKPLTNEDCEMRCRTMDARLKSVCAGLLESVEALHSSQGCNNKVTFLHRTVHDGSRSHKYGMR